MNYRNSFVHLANASAFILVASCSGEHSVESGYEEGVISGHDESTLLRFASGAGVLTTGVFGSGHSHLSDDGSTLIASMQVYRACCVGYQHLLLFLPVESLPTMQAELLIADVSAVDEEHAGVQLEVGSPDGFELVSASSGSLTVRRLEVAADGFDFYVVFNDVGFISAAGPVTLSGILDAGTSYRYSATRSPYEVICDEPTPYDPLAGGFSVCAAGAYTPAFIACAEMVGNDSEVAVCALAALDAVPIECGSFCDGTFENVPIPFLATPGPQP